MAQPATERTQRGRLPPPRRGERFWDTNRRTWRYAPRRGGKVVDLHSPEGERALHRDRGGFDGGGALRRAGATVDRGATRTARAGSRLGRRSLRPTTDVGLGLGELAVYVFASVIGLALLRNALEGRGPAALQKVFDAAGAAMRKLADPHDPIIAKGTVPPDVAAATESQAVAERTAGVAPEIQGGLGSKVYQRLSKAASGFLPAGARYKAGRADQGRDFQTNPGGPIVAPGYGRVVAVKSDPSGFGPDYPVVHFTSGPFKGKTLYIGHTHAALRAGDTFAPGQVLSTTGRSPVGNAGVAGWAEIGYAKGNVPGPFGQTTPF